MEQQQQTLEYFRRHARDWQRRAEATGEAKVNVVRQRHAYVERVAVERRPRRFLDVGCGSGQLVCRLARRGIDAVGVDFSPEMIALCREESKKYELRNAEFVLASIFEYRPENTSFDLISACGFIEYISAHELELFLRQAHAMLQDGGALVLGSRNRLFNAVSMNRYTTTELALGALQELIAESTLLCDAENIHACLAGLDALDRTLPRFADHPATGVDVATRHQYTPAELLHLLKRCGFALEDLHPVHFHAGGPRFARQHGELHVGMSEIVEERLPGAYYLIPFSSSFMLTATRR